MTSYSSDEIIIVSGLPRSGTSMMMKMLEAGGVSPFQDDVRQADTDNPNGYYEYEGVKNLGHNAAWLAQAAGHAVKIISSLLPHIPDNLNYKIIFMERQIAEVLASQQKMLERNGQEKNASDKVMAAKFSMHLRKIKKSLAEQKMGVLYVNYAAVINEPSSQAAQVSAFLDSNLNIEKMAMVVDKNLYRQRG